MTINAITLPYLTGVKRNLIRTRPHGGNDFPLIEER
jgi:hypothetical protein